MAQPLNKQQYFENITSYNRLTWLGSALAALALNLLLFVLMPQLMHQAPSAPTIEKVVPQVHVTRMTQQERRVEPEVKPLEPTEPKPEAKPEVKNRTRPRQEVTPKMSLPFEINPRLPGGPDTLDLPPMETGAHMPAGNNANVFSEGDLDAPLTVLLRIPPVYPLRARRLGMEGWVKVSFLVDKSGHVGRIKILDAEPEGVFEQSVRQCVSKWRFKPGTIEGVAVKARMETTIQFKLE
ncbi:MAG: TonB family protein [Desulfosalsimonadaceae bacterium]